MYSSGHEKVPEKLYRTRLGLTKDRYKLSLSLSGKYGYIWNQKNVNSTQSHTDSLTHVHTLRQADKFMRIGIGELHTLIPAKKSGLNLGSFRSPVKVIAAITLQRIYNMRE